MKKIVAAICAFALALALPFSAFAAESESPVIVITTVDGTNGTSLTVSGTRAASVDLIVIPLPPDTQAKNVPAGVTPIASYKAYYTDGHDEIGSTLTLTFNVGAENAGRTATVYIEHQAGDVEQVSRTVSSDGSISISVDRLSVFSIVLGDKGGSSEDKSATSPKTGMDFTGAAALAGVALIGAGAAFAARRKMSE